PRMLPASPSATNAVTPTILAMAPAALKSPMLLARSRRMTLLALSGSARTLCTNNALANAFIASLTSPCRAAPRREGRIEQPPHKQGKKLRWPFGFLYRLSLANNLSSGDQFVNGEPGCKFVTPAHPRNNRGRHGHRRSGGPPRQRRRACSMTR